MLACPLKAHLFLTVVTSVWQLQFHYEPQEGDIISECVLISALQIKAALRTVVPAEQKYLEEEPKVSKQVSLCII